MRDIDVNGEGCLLPQLGITTRQSSDGRVISIGEVLLDLSNLLKRNLEGGTNMYLEMECRHNAYWLVFMIISFKSTKNW